MQKKEEIYSRIKKEERKHKIFKFIIILIIIIALLLLIFVFIMRTNPLEYILKLGAGINQAIILGASKQTCTDSDGGKNYAVKGTAVAGRNSKTDYCSSTSNLVEYFCSVSSVKSVNYACGTGKICSDGACIAGCNPDCAGKTCGDNGCGGSCGICGGGYICNSTGNCVIEEVPTCSDDLGCISVGSFCDVANNLPYTCTLNSLDGCYDRINGTSCGTGYTCTNGICTSISVPSLISHWKFDGNANDNKSVNNGIIFGDSKFVEGVQGQALSFDGFGDYVSVSDSDSLEIYSNDYSIGFWIKAQPIQKSYAGILWKGNDVNNQYKICFDSFGQKLRNNYYSNGSDRINYTIAAVNDNVWHHVFLTVDRDGNYVWYIDSVVDSTGIFNEITNVDTGAIPFEIGRGNIDGFNGSLDNLMIYNYALTETEVKNIYDLQKPVVSSECTYSNNCFYVSVIGAGSHSGGLGNEMNLNEAMSYANANLGKSITFMLEEGNYGAVNFVSSNNRTASVVYKSVNSRKAVFGTINIGNSGGKINQKLTLDGVSVIIDPVVKPTPTGDWISGYNFGSIINSAEVTIKNSYFNGFDKYVVTDLLIQNTNNILLLNNEIKTFVGNFPKVYDSISIQVINNTLSNISVGSIIRFDTPTCRDIIIKGNNIFNCNVDYNDFYFPYLILGDAAKYHPGSVFSMRADDYVIDGNIVHDCHVAQTLKNYDAVGTFSNLTIQNNVFYDTEKNHIWHLAPTSERPVIIRNNTFIGYININTLINQYNIMQRYSNNIQISFENNNTGAYIYNNIITGYWGLPDIENLSNGLKQDNNVFYSYNNLGVYSRRGQNTIFAVWQDTAFHGYPNFFEDIGYRGTTPEYSYSTNGITPFFVNPGFYTKNIGWDDGTSYRYAGAAVRYFQNGKYYQSLQDNNLNHTPIDSPTWWLENSSLSFWEKDMRRYDFDYHPLINSVICNGGYINGNRIITNAVKGVASAGALPCVCTASSQCVEVYGAGSTCNLATRNCEGGGLPSVEPSRNPLQNILDIIHNFMKRLFGIIR